MSTTTSTIRIIESKGDYEWDSRLVSAVHAETHLPDGTPVTIRGQVIHLNRNEIGRRWNSPEARVYIDVPNETVLDHLVNRRNRPWTEWKRHVMPTVVEALPALQEALYRIPANDPSYPTFMLPEEIKVRWSQKAGCEMCPCSPGFILTDVRGSYGNSVTFYIEVGNDD